MPVSPKNCFNSSDAASLRYLAVTGLSTTAVSIKSLATALGLKSISAAHIMVDSGAAANCMLGNSSAQPVPLAAGADLVLPLLGDNVYIKAASGTIDVYCIFLGT